MKNTLLIILTIVGVVAMVVSTAAYSWLFVKVRGTIAQVAFTAEEAQLLATKNAHTQTVRRIVRDTQEEREELNEYFLTQDEIVVFLEDVESLTADSGAKVSVETVGEGASIDKDGLVKPLLVDLKLSGTLEEVFHALALIETFPKAVTVRDARITQSPAKKTWQGVLNIHVIKVEEPENT